VRSSATNHPQSPIETSAYIPAQANRSASNQTDETPERVGGRMTTYFFHLCSLLGDADWWNRTGIPALS
jgi:hypothetical protein